MKTEREREKGGKTCNPENVKYQILSDERKCSNERYRLAVISDAPISHSCPKKFSAREFWQPANSRQASK